MSVRIRICGGYLENTSRGTRYVGTDGRCVCFVGVRVRRGGWFVPSRVAFQFCGRIYVGRKWAGEDFSVLMIAHEYGHFLQQRELGFWRYLWRVAYPSVLSVLRDPYGHLHHPVEEDATRRGLRYYYAHACSEGA